MPCRLFRSLPGRQILKMSTANTLSMRLCAVSRFPALLQLMAQDPDRFQDDDEYEGNEEEGQEGMADGTAAAAAGAAAGQNIGNGHAS